MCFALLTIVALTTACSSDDPDEWWKKPGTEQPEPETPTDPETPEEPEVVTAKPRYIWIDASANFVEFANSKENIARDLKKAFDAYQLSIDPYAHYRIGQAYEEGWTGEPNMKKAMKWYQQAAEEGHHLAIKRLKK